MTRGFVLGATAGRTTLNGEGLQHEDGHSLLLASTNPAAVSYDPAFAFEIGHIVQDGCAGCTASDSRRTSSTTSRVYNEPLRPAGRARGRRRRGHPARHPPLLARAGEGDGPEAQILASGVAVQWALEAQRLLARRLGRAGRRLVGDVVERAAPRRPGRRRAQLPDPDGEPRGAVRHPGAGGRAGPVRRGVRLHARGAGPDRAVGARRLRVAGHRRLRPVRHPRCAAPALQGRRRVDRGEGAERAGPPRRGQAGGVREAIDRYQLADVNAAPRPLETASGGAE